MYSCVLLELLDLLCEELEAGEGVEARNAVLLRRRARHLGGDDALEHRRMRRHGVRQLLRGDDVIGEQHADLIAGQGDILAGLVLEDDAGTVGVRVGADDQINIVLLCQLDGERKAFLVLRVRVLDGREIAVDLHLLGLADNVLVAQTAQDLGHQTVAGTVERRVHQLEIIGNLLYAVRIYRNLNDFAEVSLVGLLRQNTDQTVFDGLIVVCSFYTGEDIGLCHFAGNHVCLGRRKLRAVLPVNLVAVVLRRVVAGGDVDAGDAAKLADGKGKLRRRAQRLEPVRLDAICRQCQRCFLGKFRGHMTGVKCDRHAFCRAALLDDVICQSLGRTADGVDIHPVNTCTDDAAQSCRTKLQIHIETLFNLIFIALNGAQFLFRCLVKVWIFQPFFVNRHVILHDSLTPCFLLG